VVNPRTVMMLGVFVFLSSSPFFSCVRLPDEVIPVRDHFEVAVHNEANPVVGMEVLVQVFDVPSASWRTIANATTDTAGLAKFAGLPSGSYSVVTHTAVENDGHPIEITNDKKKRAQERLDLVWPPKKLIVARNFEGILSSWPGEESPSEPVSGVRLTALEAHSGEAIATVLTDANGAFRLTDIPPGMYFLRVGRDEKSEQDARVLGFELHGNIAVQYNPLDRDASQSLRLDLMMSDCGLMYRGSK